MYNCRSTRDQGLTQHYYYYKFYRVFRMHGESATAYEMERE